MGRKYLGSAITDANGVATLNYTGVGAGKINIIAESGNVSSAPLQLYDTLWQDLGVSATSSEDSTWNNSTTTTTLVGDSYTEIKQATSGVFGSRTFNVPSGHSTFEFDLYVHETTSETVPAVMSLRMNTQSIISIVSTTVGIQRNVWQHIKLEILENGTKCRVYVDGVPYKNLLNIQGEYNRFQFSINVGYSDLNIRYKNFIVY